MSNPFSGVSDAPYAPATRALAVVPDDTAPLSDTPKGLYVGTGGDIVMRGLNGTSDQTWKAVPSGTVLPFRAQYVRATGTTAADMLALY
jgi:type 1 fimbria pilin